MRQKLLLKLLTILCIAIFFQIGFGQIPIGQTSIQAKLFDSRNYVGADDADMQINMFSNELKKTSNSIGYIIIYGGKVTKRGEIDAHIKGIRAALAFYRIDEGSVFIVKGGFHKTLTIDYWIAPKEAIPP
ncbi:MAG: hypothetical protein HC846_07370, partial [Blastocatellia bacterium]|nr:hypothetical protein [Blastocatellia bacterium]